MQPWEGTILVVGGGGREHALARRLAESPGVSRVVVAPGNAGTRATGGPGAAPIERALLPGSAPDAVAELAARLEARLVVFGPEAHLVAGAADAVRARGILAFGPGAEAARLEGSKIFMKRFAERHRIPTAPFAVATSMAEVEAILAERGAPIVVKADGLCAGKGVVVAGSLEEAREAARAALELGRFGEAGRALVLEDVLPGEEASVHAVTDGERLFVLPVARDHKRLFAGDRGPNTGGMGAVAPSARVTPELLERVLREILRPTIDGLRDEGAPFRGVLFAGLMVTPAGDPVLLEHNVRFGDPECEAILPLVEGDFASLLGGAAAGRLDATRARLSRGRVAISLVLAAPGYPERPETGDAIEGLFEAEAQEGVRVFHAGTAEREGRVVTAGGRVLVVMAEGKDVGEARARVYGAARKIRFRGMQLREDVGQEIGAA